ncbi:PAS domain-containing protein [Spirilliplanes yamanashiensis]|uniref:Transcriptional regulator n=1 Tax=Spirilliplanes yamanashiensis TaxID=42233 RepID=A0A8J3Y424_9ACTN|nr:PAS domain-containing protein [Spirilliplanes yamanashiensis]MDP9819845.1 PAS domain S-box-containing protein [Spirilliplanes yamanashiensis]GIJ01336.1 transcriptional regulator [Spirilliplanes yamanashiensis]
MERTFGDDEIIVSKTDLRGLFTYANDVFLRTSALTEDETVGQPHNIIRHPDMPRAVFKLLWDTLKRREELFAYVVNLAADGAHYWVLAHVTPSFDGAGTVVGYHSSRRRPERRAVDAAAALYAELRAAEQRGPGGSGGQAGLDASWKLLHERLGGRSYDEFVWDLTNGGGR